MTDQKIKEMHVWFADKIAHGLSDSEIANLFSTTSKEDMVAIMRDLMTNPQTENDDKRLVKGRFISVWDNDVRIATEAALDMETGELDIKTIEIDHDGVLVKELFESNGDEIHCEVCPVCHDHILVGRMKPNKHTPKVLEEVIQCADLDCGFNQE